MNLTMAGENTIEKTNIKVGTVNSYAKMASCNINGEGFLFYNYVSTNSIYISQVDPNNYTNLNVLSSIFVGMEIIDIKLSEDCNSMFAAGFYLWFLDVTDKLNPIVVNKLPIRDIVEIQLIKTKFLYVMTEQATQKLDISDLTNPKYLIKQVFPYIYNALMSYTSAFIIDSNTIYHYRPFFDIFSDNDYILSTPITRWMETVSPYYAIILNSPRILIGIRAIIYYTVITTGAEFYKASDVVNDLTLEIDEVNSLFETAVPSWISFDFNKETITITADPSYLNKPINLAFGFLGPVEPDYGMDSYDSNHQSFRLAEYKQSFQTSIVEVSLNVNLDQNNQISINSPSSQNIVVILTFLNNASSFSFIADNFPGVFLTNSPKQGKLTATGFLQPINSMLLDLRYTTNNQIINDSISMMFSFNVSDQLNPNYINNYSLNSLLRNHAPIVNNSLENQLEKSMYYNTTICQPSKTFQFTFSRNTFIDVEGDAIQYTIQNYNTNIPLPLWLNYDSTNLIIDGIPSLSDEGTYNLNLIANDGYDWNSTSLNFTIFDNPPQQNINLSNQTAQIGVNFSYQVPINTFIDNDGPQALPYSFQISASQCGMIDINNFWLNFFPNDRIFYGIPLKADMLYCQNFNLVVFAFDGLKYSNCSFALEIQQSMSILDDKTWPAQFISPNNSFQLSVTLNSSKSKLLILQAFRGAISWQSNQTLLTSLVIGGGYQQIDQALKNVIVRRNENSSEELVNLSALDEYDQQWKNIYTIQQFPVDKNFIYININAILIGNPLVLVGSVYRYSIESNLFISDNINMTITYSLSLEYDGKTTDIIQLSPDSFQLYSASSIGSDLIGTYQASLIATDEFLDSYDYQFTITIDYSLQDKIINAMKLLGTIVGPLLSIIAIIRYYHFFYNFIRNSALQIDDKIIYANKAFKWKIPIIQEDISIGRQIKIEFMKKIKKDKSPMINNFLQQLDDDSKKPQPLHKFPDFQNTLHSIQRYLDLENEQRETIKLLVEALILNDLLTSKIPFFQRVFESFKKATEELLKSKNVHKCNAQWYNHYFNENGCSEGAQLTDYVLKIGKFERCEKNISLNVSEIEKILEISLKIINFKKKSNPIFNSWKQKYVYFIILSLINNKRGITPYLNRRFLLMFDSFLEIFGIKFLPFRIGDSIYGHIHDFDQIQCKFRYGKRQMKQEFFSFEGKNLPVWMTIEQKRGILIIKGEPPDFAKNREYSITMKNKWNLIICGFWIVIKDAKMIKTITTSSISKIKNKRMVSRIMKYLNTGTSKDFEMSSPNETEDSPNKSNRKLIPKENEKETLQLTKSEFIMPNENDKAVQSKKEIFEIQFKKCG